MSNQSDTFWLPTFFLSKEKKKFKVKSNKVWSHFGSNECN